MSNTSITDKWFSFNPRNESLRWRLWKSFTKTRAILDEQKVSSLTIVSSNNIRESHLRDTCHNEFQWTDVERRCATIPLISFFHLSVLFRVTVSISKHFSYLNRSTQNFTIDWSSLFLSLRTHASIVLSQKTFESTSRLSVHSRWDSTLSESSKDIPHFITSRKKEDNWKPLILRMSLPSSFAWVFFNNVSTDSPWQLTGQFQKSSSCFFLCLIYTAIHQSVSHCVWTDHVPVDHGIVCILSDVTISSLEQSSPHFDDVANVSFMGIDSVSRSRQEIQNPPSSWVLPVIIVFTTSWLSHQLSECKKWTENTLTSFSIVYILMSKWSCRCRSFPRLCPWTRSVPTIVSGKQKFDLDTHSVFC